MYVERRTVVPDETQSAAVRHVSTLTSIPVDALNGLVAYEIDFGARPGTSDQAAELKWLRRENSELRRANVILKSASVFSRRSSAALLSDCGSHGTAVGLV